MPEARLHIDYESRSVVDLKKHGLSVYANHPTTEVSMMSYQFDEEKPSLWLKGEPLPKRIADHVRSGGTVVAHNAVFEWTMWNVIMKKKFAWPNLKIEQCDCTMARAYAMALPGSLEKVAPALGLNVAKDSKGKALMMKMSKPRSFEDDGTIVWWESPEQIERLGRYCIQDTVVEAAVDNKLLPLSKAERAIWIMDQKINQRGVGVDRDAIEKTQKLIDVAKKKLNKEIKIATDGHIKATTEATKILAYCQDKGIHIENLKKMELENWLKKEDLPDEVREVLQLRSDGSKSSLAKLQTALDMSLVDGRLRGMFQYHGATTGRFAARGVQLHNLPRPEPDLEEPSIQEGIINYIAEGGDDSYIECFYGPFLRVIVSCIRGYLTSSEGHDFIGADLANIEGRVLAWMAGEEWKIQAFRDFDAGTGPDLYKISATKIYKVDDIETITKLQRLIGKVGELALGYQGAVGAFKSMAAVYGVETPDEQAKEIVDGWRSGNKKIVKFWYDVGDAAMEAIRCPGAKISAGVKGREVVFRVAGNYLWLRLPSGRVLCYPYPEINNVLMNWGQEKPAVTFMGVDGRAMSKTKGKFVRLSSYGGKFTENIVQAVARDILTEAWQRIEDAGYPIILHVHDENVSEVPEGFGSVEEYERLMSVLPEWAEGLPVSAEGFRGKRYRK